MCPWVQWWHNCHGGGVELINCFLIGCEPWFAWKKSCVILCLSVFSFHRSKGKQSIFLYWRHYSNLKKNFFACSMPFYVCSYKQEFWILFTFIWSTVGASYTCILSPYLHSTYLLAQWHPPQYPSFLCSALSESTTSFLEEIQIFWRKYS